MALDLAPLGLGPTEGFTPYFCTPAGAKVFGCEGVDGIHYCTLPGYGEAVFVVNPTALPGQYIQILARNFGDFIQLLLACGHTAALEQARNWDEAQFDAFLAENPATPEGRAALDALARALDLRPMERPYEYLRALQAEVDCSALQPPAEAEAPSPPWAVTYEGNFWGGKGRPGRKISVKKTFFWANRRWYVPAVYACGKGLVADMCMEADVEAVRAFARRWADVECPTRAEQERMALENPLERDFRAAVEVNGRAAPAHHGCGLCWLPPDCGEACDPEAERAAAHYGLDRSRAWSIQRLSFPWPTARRPKLQSLRLFLEDTPQARPGPRLSGLTAGDTVVFTLPVAGTAHTLEVLDIRPETVEGLPRGDFDWPQYCTALTYRLTPDLPPATCQLRDLVENDPPRRKSGAPHTASAIGIIGGADGAASQAERPVHTAHSALHFAPADHIEWELVFREREWPDFSVDLL